MSTNLHIVAERTISFRRKNGSIGSDKQRVMFNAFQTPTDVTFKIINDEAGELFAYIEYVRSLNITETVELYAEDDVWGENPIGTRVDNISEEHITELTNWINEMEEEGFEIIFEAW